MNRKRVCELIDSPSADGPDFEISAITEDSRRARPGALFVAVSGAKSDGHAFAADAIARGAAAVLGDRAGLNEIGNAPYISVSNPRRAAGIIAQALAGNPSSKLCVIGVTGTNGKSSTVYLVQSILNFAGLRCAKLGTLGYDFGGVAFPTEHTTPFAEDLAGVFSGGVEAGCTHVVMETSSHALEQERVAGIRFRVGAFTNLTQDHLDYHKTMEDYGAAKLKLLESLEGDDSFAVLNGADPSVERFKAATRVRSYTFGKGGDISARGISGDIGGTRFTLSTPWGDAPVGMKLLGKHNVANALCAAGICGGLGVPVDKIAAGIAALKAVPGRFEAIQAGQDFFVVVDYAHTDDGLRNVLAAARKLCGKRVICVFGCGGDRDKTKRPKMGAVAAELADFSIVTSDNPRTEDPHRILLDIEVGMQHAGKKKGNDYWVIEDRAEAIQKAIGLAKPGDFVMIAGKGHEDYQILGTSRSTSMIVK
jgi:UDP-N-acetylmuramoyl-L-alanyl-D-glutamate--2,6-diaminopimelate ligase